MLRKTFEWYYKTALLKTKAYGYAFREDTAFFKLIENSNKKRKEELPAFSDRTPDRPLLGTFSPAYLAFAFFDDPAPLFRQLTTGKKNPLFRIDYQRAPAYNPLVPAYTGLVLFNSLLEDPLPWKQEKILDNYRFLKAYGLEVNNALFFPYFIDLPKFNLKAPWVSGIAQAKILSFFLRIHSLQKDPLLLEQGRKIARSFFVPVEAGGVFTLTEEGFPWIAEYPAAPVPYVLNGFLFALIALYECRLVVPEAVGSDDLNRLSESFFQTFHHFRRGWNLKYCRTRKDLANIQYLGLFVFQLLHLYHLTGEPAWKRLAMDWDQQVDWPFFCRFHGIKEVTSIRLKINAISSF